MFRSHHPNKIQQTEVGDSWRICRSTVVPSGCGYQTSSELFSPNLLVSLKTPLFRFTIHNVVITNADTAIYQLWNW